MNNNILRAINESTEKLSVPASYESMSYARTMPSIDRLKEIVNLCREIIFPGYFAVTPIRPESISHFTGVYLEQLAELLSREIYAGLCFTCEQTCEHACEKSTTREQADNITAKFILELPELRRMLHGDVVAIFNGDPAAKSFGEIIYAYPSIKAISNYRIAHLLLTFDVPLIPRIITEMAHSETGIDIHPRAQIGENFAIDHGTGVVIGATSIIGNNVKIYQGVTLGAKSFPSDENGNPIKGIARHPIIEDNVIIYAQATILGRITVGKDSVIGGNVWVTDNVPPGSKVVQRSAKNSM